MTAIYDLSLGKYVSRSFIKYCFVGLSGVFVNQISLYLFKHIFYFSNQVSLFFAIEISLITNFLLNNYWTFSHKKTRKPNTFFKNLLLFHLICSGGFIINQSITIQIMNYTGWDIMFANLFGITFATIWNFSINSKLTWK